MLVKMRFCNNYLHEIIARKEVELHS